MKIIVLKFGGTSVGSLDRIVKISISKPADYSVTEINSNEISIKTPYEVMFFTVPSST